MRAIFDGAKKANGDLDPLLHVATDVRGDRLDELFMVFPF
jgi:hypothetical protein